MKDDAAAPPRGALPQAETGADAAVPDRQFLRDHPVETAFLVNRFVVLHLLRVNEAFGGDITAAIVLGSLAHHNYRRFYDEVVAQSDEDFGALLARGAHLPHLRPCNALSISESTGIPRETVRRKVKALIARGWVRQEARDKLYVTDDPARHFGEFDADTVRHFEALLGQLARAQERVAGPAAAGGGPASGRRR